MISRGDVSALTYLVLPIYNMVLLIDVLASVAGIIVTSTNAFTLYHSLLIPYTIYTINSLVIIHMQQLPASAVEMFEVVVITTAISVAAVIADIIIVNRDELESLLEELRTKTPEEIKRYQKIISNKEAILADAQNKADAIIAEAQAKAREMVEQSEVMQTAYAQANETVNNANQQAQEILDAATNDANSIRLGAIGYTDDMLANLSNIMTTALNDAGEKYNSFVESLTSCYNTVVQNRSELSPQGAPEEEQPEEEVVVPEYDPASEEESEEE
jgi:vacuolar-type H+-ATPase subunit H